MAKKTFVVGTHILVPEHILLSEKEKNALYEKYGISFKELPKIYINDPAIAHMKVKQGDVINVVKKSITAGKAEYYRGVISE